MYYNFCRIHKTLRVTPAMEAKVTDKLWDIEDIVKLLDEIYFKDMNKILFSTIQIVQSSF